MDDELEVVEDAIPAALANHYDARDLIIKTSGPLAARASLEMWSALLQIAYQRSWRARFNSQNEWLAYLKELNIFGLSRANILSKIKSMHDLSLAGAHPELAAAAAAMIPAAAEELNTVGKMKQATGDADVNDYLSELLVLPNPGEAVGKVRQDKGNEVAMWIQDIAPGKYGALMCKIVREDSDGYSSFDVAIGVSSQQGLPTNGVVEWLKNRLRGKA
jgi:hypothetical protein